MRSVHNNNTPYDVYSIICLFVCLFVCVHIARCPDHRDMPGYARQERRSDEL